MIPQPLADQRGWSVEPDGTVHLRWQDHAPSAQKVATEQGVINVLGDKYPKTCKRCFPHGNRQRPDVMAKKGQKRRVPPNTDPYEREP